MANTLTAPASVRDTWPPPNFFDPETQGSTLEYLCISFGSVGLTIVALRLYSRAFITRLLGLDDALMVIAIAICIALSVLLIIGTKAWYVGYHIWDLPAASVIEHRKGMWIGSYLYIFASGCIKISVLLFYRRLNIVFSNAFLTATYIGIAYNICYIIGFAVANTLICSPTEAFWLRYDMSWRVSHEWSCGNEAISLPTSGAFSIFGDLYSTIIPLILVTSLDLPRRQKMALYALFGLGFLVVGAGIARTVLLSYTVLRTYDFTWMVYEVWIWSIVELYVAVFTASAPALKPLLGKIFGQGFLGYSHPYSRSKSAMSEMNDRKIVIKRLDVENDRFGSLDARRILSHKQSQDLESRATDDEGRHIIRHVASAGLHGSMSSDEISYDVELDSLDHTTLASTRHQEKISPAVSTITEEEYARSIVSSVEVDPPVYPPNVLRKDHNHGHRRVRSDSTIGTAITTNEVIEFDPNAYHHAKDHNGRIPMWNLEKSRPSSSGARRPPSAFQYPTRKSSDHPRPSQLFSRPHEAELRGEQDTVFHRPKTPVYDAERSQRSEPIQKPYPRERVCSDADLASCYSSEADEKRQDAILIAAQQSRLSAQRKPDTQRSSLSDTSWDLPFQGEPKRRV